MGGCAWPKLRFLSGRAADKNLTPPTCALLFSTTDEHAKSEFYG